VVKYGYIYQEDLLMGRLRREEYKGWIYHVIARGNNKEYIFNESMDKAYFIKQVKETTKGMNCRTFGFVLMSNHYHLIVQTFDKRLHEIMHYINSKYSKYFNNKYGRVGHVFEGRYKAIPVQDERYLMDLLRYIHQNPVVAQICDAVEKYKWSSDVFYRSYINDFICTDVLLDMLNKDRKSAVKKYRELMLVKADTDYDNMRAIGDEAYQIMCMSRRRNESSRMRLDEILFSTGIEMTDYLLVKAGSRKRDLTVYKLEYIRAALNLKYTNREIGQNIGFTESAIKQLIARHGR
jgi:REP element-mobilizing transposase RayT